MGGEEEMTNPFLYFVTARFLEEHLQKEENDKNRVRSGAITVLL
jgi:hypothetical protein